MYNIYKKKREKQKRKRKKKIRVGYTYILKNKINNGKKNPVDLKISKVKKKLK